MRETKLSRIVMVIERDELMREELCGVLRRDGWRVLVANTAEKAFALMRTVLGINVLFVDIAIDQRVSGWDIADAFRVLHPDGAVIYASEPIEDRTRAVRSSMFFAKPYAPADVNFVCSTLRDVQSLQEPAVSIPAE